MGDDSTVNQVHVYEISLDQLRDPILPPAELETAWKALQRLSAAEAQILHYRMRLAIAENPNTPASVLNEAAGEHAAAVLKNSVLPLLAIEDPALSCFNDFVLAMLHKALGEMTSESIRHLIRTIYWQRMASIDMASRQQW